ncbi:MAG: GNVR domain-containing protein, partial [Sideroxydans sp.]|nr:GNVR domain-containing protein [Gallionella sp.]MDD5059485.1 GNVR domain-containing protein [Sideroxydans sp.]
MTTNLPAIGFQGPHGFQEPHDAVDLGHLGQILRRRAGTIVMFVVGATLFALIYVLFSTPQFTVHGALFLGDSESAADVRPSGLNFLSDYSTQSDVETQIELITAGALVQHAVLETGLNAQITPAGAPPLTYWRWQFYHGGQTKSFVPGPTTLQALYAATPGRYRIVVGKGNSYTLYTQHTLFAHAHFVLRGILGRPAAGGGIHLLLEPAGDHFHAAPGTSYDLRVSSPEALANSLLAGALTVTAGGPPTQPTKIATLQFRWNNPWQGRRFVNQVMADYIATQLSWNTQSASTTASFVTEQLTHISASLAQADKKLATYQAQTGLVDVPQNAAALINQLAQYQAQRAKLELQKEELQQINSSLSAQHGLDNPYLVSQSADTVLPTLTTALSDAETKLAQLRSQFTDNSQHVKVQEAQVVKIEASIRAIVHNNLAVADKNLANLDKIIAQFQERIKAMPTEALNVISLQRSTNVLGQLYALLMEKDEEAQVSKAATIINTRIVTPADMPLIATSPKAVITIVFGALAGLIAGVSLVFGQHSFSGRFESEEQIRLAVRLPVYGAVPRQTKAEITGNIFGPKKLNPFSESFRLLRGNIYRGTVPKTSMVILIISSSKEDGKTTVAANLAKILADDGKRVVLVDADLHLSPLDGLLKFGDTLGLTSWLETGTRPTLQNWPDENFKVLPAGAASFSRREPLNETALGAIFQNLKNDFEYIIVDSPPLPTVSAGMTLGIFADLILSVISVSHTSRRAFNLHNELIAALGRPHGIIINEVESLYYRDD